MRQFINKPNECVTTTDGRKIWVSRSVAVVGVFCVCTKDANTHVLIEKRGTNPGLDKQGLWCLPCGYLDWNETAEDAIQREAWEEIGLDLDDLVKKYQRFDEGDYLTKPWAVKSEPDENRQNVTLRYACTFNMDDLPSLKPNNDCEPNEVADATWVNVGAFIKPDLSALEKYDFAFNHDVVIRKYFELVERNYYNKGN